MLPASIYYCGDILAIELKVSTGRSYVDFDGRKISVHAKNECEAEKEIYKWVKRRASLSIKQSVWRQSRILGITEYRLKIGDQKSRWGSCSQKRNLSFNFRIGLAPKQVMDYVVLHELVHLKIMNHSGKFWTEIGRLCPDYKKYETWLRKNSYLLMSLQRN